jgi:poly(3-hydroxyalkanoate) synthetase
MNDLRKGTVSMIGMKAFKSGERLSQIMHAVAFSKESATLARYHAAR